VIVELEELAGLVCGLGAYWGVNITENLKYGFAGVNLDGLVISESGDIEKVITILKRIKSRYTIRCILRDVDIQYIGNYLRNPRSEAEIPCTLGFDGVYLDPRGNVYSACMSMKPVGNVLKTDWEDILRSPQMRTNLKAMLLRRCGGCTCGYAQRAERMQGLPSK
jgi:MoaA/NifB/PqqE/SkfB family radical SAM enzyme